MSLGEMALKCTYVCAENYRKLEDLWFADLK